MDKTNKNGNPPKQSATFFPPVVTVLGHVDHGKTTLLDAIRKTNIAGKEHGGITQKIGASSITIEHEGQKRNITFIDTPGHEAFAKMRSRGAQAADIGLLIISSVDGIMPQTRESIQLLLGSKLPFIVVATKADLPETNIEKLKQQLMKENITIEEYGGNVPFIEVSAKTGKNIKELLELILLVMEVNAEEQAQKLSEKNLLSAIVIESRLDPQVGPRATVVVKNGQMQVRDELVSEGIQARARSFIDSNGKHIQKVTVGEAVEILGFEKVPSVGSIVGHKREQQKIKQPEASLEVKKPLVPTFYDENKLAVILAADTAGSLEAIIQALPKDMTVVLQKAGEITVADVMLAKSTGAIILGFNVPVKADVIHLARTEKVLVRNYTIIYELLDEIKDAVAGKLLAMQEQVLGIGKILASFPFEKTKVLGIGVVDGRVAKGDKVRIVRGEETVGESGIVSVRQGKNQISKVEKGAECGIILSPLIDFTIGDMVICHD